MKKKKKLIETLRELLSGSSEDLNVESIGCAHEVSDRNKDSTLGRLEAICVFFLKRICSPFIHGLRLYEAKFKMIN